MSKVYFIAEAGKNYIEHGTEEFPVEHYLSKAEELAQIAKDCGADYCKFQCHVFKDEQYLRDKDRYDWIKFNEKITPYNEFWKPLKEQCDEIGIEFLVTPMSKLAAIKVNDLVSKWKIGSGNTHDYDLLEYVASTKKPVILSTGMSTQKDIEKALDILRDSKVSLLYCKSIYPCPVGKLELKAIRFMRKCFFKPVGFSDHTREITTPMMAIMYGAEIIEKHFTCNKNAIGPDHKFSLDEDELRLAIKLVRDYENIKWTHLCILPSEEEIKLLTKFKKNWIYV